MNTVEERLARYRYELDSVESTDAAGDVKPSGAPRGNGPRALLLMAAAALMIVGLVAVARRGLEQSPATDGSTLPNEQSSVAYSTTTTLVGEPVKNGPTTAPEQWYPESKGATVASIAEQFVVSPEALAAFNGWTDGADHFVTAGSTVRIPPGASMLFNAVVPYGTLVIDTDGNTVGVGASNDLSALCLLTATEIAGCDDLYQRWPVSPTAPPPLAPVVVRSSPMANPSKTVIYGIADADLSISVVDATGAYIASATVTPAYQGRRGFAVLVDTVQGLSIVATDSNLHQTSYPAPV